MEERNTLNCSKENKDTIVPLVVNPIYRRDRENHDTHDEESDVFYEQGSYVYNSEPTLYKETWKAELFPSVQICDEYDDFRNTQTRAAPMENHRQIIPGKHRKWGEG